MPPSNHKNLKGPRISATRIQQYDDCARKWVAQAVQGFDGDEPRPLPATTAQAFGTNVHLIAEQWLRDGIAPPQTLEGRTFLGGINYLPKPKTPGVKVELPFQTKIAGKDFSGTMDCVWVREDGSVMLIDHKTTSNLRWAKTPAQLHGDQQAVAYAWGLFEQFPELELLDLRWVYYQRVTAIDEIPMAKCIDLQMSREYAKDYWEKRLAPSASSMLELYRKRAHPADVEGNPLMCKAYGGCPYRKDCESLKGKNMSNALEALLKKTKKEKPVAVIPEESKDVEAPKVEPKTTTRPSKANEQKARIAALEASTATLTQASKIMEQVLEMHGEVLKRLKDDI